MGIQPPDGNWNRPHPVYPGYTHLEVAIGTQEAQKRWTQRAAPGRASATLVFILTFLFCAPLGLVLTWRTSWKRSTKIAITAAYVLLVVAAMAHSASVSTR